MMRSILLPVAAVALSLAGCGRGAPKQAAGPPAAVGVYTSAADCAASQKLDVAQCNVLIHAAIFEHQQAANSYISLRLCEAAEGGENRCERTEGNAFRPKLQAFLVTFSAPPSAQPLYAAAAAENQLGFISRDKSRTLLTVDETLLFSDNAKVVAEGNVH